MADPQDKSKDHKPADEASKVHLHTDDAHHGDLPAHGHGHGHDVAQRPADYIPEGSVQDQILVFLSALTLIGLLFFGYFVMAGPKGGHQEHEQTIGSPAGQPGHGH